MEVIKRSYWEFLEELYLTRINHNREYLDQHKKTISDRDFTEKITEITLYKSIIKDLKLRKQWK